MKYNTATHPGNLIGVVRSFQARLIGDGGGGFPAVGVIGAGIGAGTGEACGAAAGGAALGGGPAMGGEGGVVADMPVRLTPDIYQRKSAQSVRYGKLARPQECVFPRSPLPDAHRNLTHSNATTD